MDITMAYYGKSNSNSYDMSDHVRTSVYISGIYWHHCIKLLQRQGSCEAFPTPAAFNSLVREPDRDGRDVIHSVIVRTWESLEKHHWGLLHGLSQTSSLQLSPIDHLASNVLRSRSLTPSPTPSGHRAHILTESARIKCKVTRSIKKLINYEYEVYTVIWMNVPKIRSWVQLPPKEFLAAIPLRLHSPHVIQRHNQRELLWRKWVCRDMLWLGTSMHIT